MFRKQFSEVEDACALAQAMVDTVREPLVVLDKDLRVIAASRSFYVKFATRPDDTQGKHFYELGNGEWDIPKLRLLLEKILPDHGAMDEYEVEHEFPRIGRQVMLLNARTIRYEKAHTNILLGIEDITVQRELEREKDDLLRQKGVLLDEVQHRVANSLQIIASIIMMKALSVESEDTRRHLHDAHNRVISVAAVQQHLHAAAAIGTMEMHPYLSQLCEALGHSMIGEDQSISLKVLGKAGIATCRDAERLPDGNDRWRGAKGSRLMAKEPKTRNYCNRQSFRLGDRRNLPRGQSVAPLSRGNRVESWAREARSLERSRVVLMGKCSSLSSFDGGTYFLNTALRSLRNTGRSG